MSGWSGQRPGHPHPARANCAARLNSAGRATTRCHAHACYHPTSAQISLKLINPSSIRQLQAHGALPGTPFERAATHDDNVDEVPNGVTQTPTATKIDVTFSEN